MARHRPEPTPDDAVAALREQSTLSGAARALGISRHALRDLLAASDNTAANAAAAAACKTQPARKPAIPDYGREKHVDWRDDSACLDEDPDLFFPIGTTGPALAQIEEAKAVCRRCPVIAVCRQWALDTRQEFGVWGGLSEDELRSIRRRGQAARCAARQAVAS